MELDKQVIEQIVKQVGVTRKQIKTVLEMLDEGNTVPFIARYRKEQTGALDEEQIREIHKAYEYSTPYQKIGKVIGQETGGNLNDINGGQVLFLTLPNSGIEIDFPVMSGFSIPERPNGGVVPDIMVEYKLDDIIKKSDLEVNKILDLIKKTAHSNRD